MKFIYRDGMWFVVGAPPELDHLEEQEFCGLGTLIDLVMPRDLNRSLLRQIADEIENYPELYNQSVWGWYRGSLASLHSCKTPCCVAGFAVAIANTQMEGNDIIENASCALNLRPGEAAQLFDPFWPGEWWKKAGLPGFAANEIPNASEAPAILRAIADGRIVLGRERM